MGHAAPRREARRLAAVLACGPGAVLSHASAGELWEIRDALGLLEVTIPRRSVLEDAFPRLCRRHRVPAPRAQMRRALGLD